MKKNVAIIVTVVFSCLMTMMIFVPILSPEKNDHRALANNKMIWRECFEPVPITALACKTLIESEIAVRNPDIKKVIIVNPLGKSVRIITNPAGKVLREVHNWREENFGTDKTKKTSWDCVGLTGEECCKMVQKDEPLITCNITSPAITSPAGQSKVDLIERGSRLYICADHADFVRKIPAAHLPDTMCQKV